jgi:hypothetical protein
MRMKKLHKKKPSVQLIRISVEQTVFDPDAIDTRIYVLNCSQEEVLIECLNASFITLDDSGTATAAGNEKKSFKLQVGEVKLITEVAGWEWDGFVGAELMVISEQSQIKEEISFNFKHSDGDIFLPFINKTGRNIVPLTFHSSANK